MAALRVPPLLVPPSPLRGHLGPLIVVAWGWWGVALLARWSFSGGCPALHLRSYFVQVLLQGDDELLRLACVVRRVDCVSAHATLVINVYPRRSAAGSVLGFGLAPSTPPGAKVLRAGLAVIARRAYVLLGHDDGVDRCLRRCPGAVPPGLRLCLMLSGSRHTAPRAASAFGGAWVLRFSDAGALHPVVAGDLWLFHRAARRGLVDPLEGLG